MTFFNIGQNGNWGNASPYVQSLYTTKNCDQVDDPATICGKLMDGRGIIPGGGWGTARPPHRKQWTDAKCVPKNACRYMKNTYGIVPGSGVLPNNMPTQLQTAWRSALECDKYM
jgi:hypothetical protein